MEEFEPRAFLRFALSHFGLPLLREEGPYFYLDRGYCIELEGPQLYKLSQNDQVIAPFADLEEMCIFIQKDRQQYEED
ncbi:MAG: hypothetical protein AAFW73_11275 [Bacteroidota bacterium]